MKLSVVIAAYDEAANIEPLFKRLEAALNSMSAITSEAIFVIEGNDGTHEALKRITAGLPWVRILYNEKPSGLGAAFRQGFDAVSDDADYVVTLDADLNHQPEEIPRLLEAARSGDSDVLVGSRFVSGGRIEGTPLWKRALSGSVNVLMHWLYGLDVRDKTSGFRIYRAEALRRINYHNQAFAFLPEILISARRAGYRIAEAPIHFVFRERGRSKMDFWPTSMSYLVLLWRRFDSWSWAVAALLLLGLALRVAMTFPIHAPIAEADSILTGLCAFKVLRWETPVFFSYYRIGSLGAHLEALLFLIGGASRTTLMIGPVIVGFWLMIFWYSFMRAVFDRRTAAVALLFVAVPSPAFSLWTSMPNGYPETVLLCASTLFLAACAVRSPRRRWLFFFLGLSAGMGLWSSLLTLASSVPAAAWLVLRRPGLLRTGRALLPALAGFLLGASPWLAFNVLYGFPSLRSNIATRPVQGLEAVLDNAAYLVSYKLPELVASIDPTLRPAESQASDWLRNPILGIYATSAILCFYLLYRARRSTLGIASFRVWGSPSWILVFVLLVTALLNIFSAVGQTRGPTVRYVLPVYLILPGFLAVSLRWIGTRSRILAGSLAAVILYFNVSGTFLPWTENRQKRRAEAAETDRLVEMLEHEKIDGIMGTYWWVYPVNFYSHERIKGIPWTPEFDHYRVIEDLEDDEEMRWALLVAGRRQRDLTTLAQRAQIEGETISIDHQKTLFLVRKPEPPREFVARMREVFGATP